MQETTTIASTDLGTVMELIHEIQIAILTTIAADGSLHSRPITTQRIAPDGTLWFITRADTAKVAEVERDDRVSLSYARPDRNEYVVISGTARLVRDREVVRALWDPLYRSWFPLGRDDPELALLHVRIEWAEFWEAPALASPLTAGFIALATPGGHGQGRVDPVGVVEAERAAVERAAERGPGEGDTVSSITQSTRWRLAREPSPARF